MYVDTAKWLLAIISGLIVFGLDRLKDHSGPSFALVSFSVASLLLVAAAAFALNYLRHSFNYVSRTVTAGMAPSEDAARSRCSAGKAYVAMLSTFAAGLALFLVFGAAVLREKSLGSDDATLVAGNNGAVLARQGPCLWALDKSGTGAHWVSLPPIGKGQCPKTP
jgi:hypothetical protein